MFTNVVAGLAVVVVVVLLVVDGVVVATGVVVLEVVVDVVLEVLVEVLLDVEEVELAGADDVVEFGVVVEAFEPGWIVVVLGAVVLVFELFDPLGAAVELVGAGEVVELLELGAVEDVGFVVELGTEVEATVVDATVGATVVATIEVVVEISVEVVVVAGTPLVNNERSAWAAPRIRTGSAPSQPESTEE